MDAKIDAKKVIRKRDRNRVLKALAYVAGFPLFILLVFIGSVPFMNGAAFEATKYYGVIVCIAAWAVLILVQIIAALVTKNSTARGVIVIIVTLIVMVGGSVYFDIWAEGKLNTTRDNYVRERYGISEDTELVYLKNQINKDILTFRDDDYVRNAFKLDSKTKLTYSEDQYGIQYVTFTRDKKTYTKAISIEVDIDNYATQINHYVTWTDKSSLTDEFNEKIADFCRVYNIEYESAVKGAVNTDGSEYGATKIEDADGNPEYWFGETGKVYKENGLYADGYIFGVESASRILIAYYDTQNYYAAQGLDADEELEKALDKARTSSAWTSYVKTDEYKAAYGPGGTVNKYMITEERLEKIIGALLQGVVDEDIIGSLPNLGFGLDLGTIVKDLLSDLGIDLNDLANASIEDILKIVQGLGLDFTMDDIMGLLGGYSNYEVSNVKPLMYFIDDARLRTYAYAKFFGQTHGTNIGSVLIPTKTVNDDGSITYGKIGQVTMSASGLSYEENAFTLDECYNLVALNGFIPEMYPLFAARRYAYIFAGIISLMFAIYYYAQMKVNLIGKKLEKMSTLGGGR